ncbi:(2S)-3-sulfopropanediol dehydratase activating enzyme [Fundidesulfovibrio soli]|uniref:(2S)-3-sulfopropanediol dehydratase activating enzyme n=1 Tax=Fundidesulfovibrio soli TaxID=2922716 RepID=UPI001FB0496B|nr:glycyl-radical enzyme activating protein [Fundidesulfovibrio soli]
MTTQQDKDTSGTIFNIQKYSVHDGPGIRTIVFFKGCPLSCLWCSNPESQAFQAELAFNDGRCLGFSQCVRCLKACPSQAIARMDDKPVFNRETCKDCARPCVEACPASGVIAYGQRKSVDEVLRVVEQDAMFYTRSGGGLTLSGGEPLAQPEFALALLREARRRRLNTSMETCAQVPWEVLRQAAPLLDSVMFDIKSLDNELHKTFTGAPNTRILDNFQRLVAEFPDLPVHVRTPVIPGFNDMETDIRNIAEFVSGHANVSYEVLPYHRLGTQKYTFLNREAPMGDKTLPQERFAELEQVAREAFWTPSQKPEVEQPASAQNS